MTTFPSEVQLEAKDRRGNKVVALSGRRTRNVDWMSGKSLRFMPEGVRLDDYQRNNILAWAHGTRSPEDILGTATMTLEKGVLIADPLINAPSDRARLVKKLWDMEILKAVSVGLGLTREDMAKAIETETEIVFPSSELRELSIVPVPADPGAVRDAALSLGIEPKRATQILMEVTAMEEDTDLQEGIEMADESGGPVFSAEDEIALAVALTNNEAAFHVMRDAFIAEVRLEYEPVLEALRAEIAELRGEPVRRQQVNQAPRRPLFATTRQESLSAAPSTPPANIRQPQRNGQPPVDPKRAVAAAMMRKRS